MLCDVRAARNFVERELGPLTAQDPRTRVLRDTLGSYLQSGLNAASTAPVLNVSDRTIAYRIHGVEDLLQVAGCATGHRSSPPGTNMFRR